MTVHQEALLCIGGSLDGTIRRNEKRDSFQVAKQLRMPPYAPANVSAVSMEINTERYFKKWLHTKKTEWSFWVHEDLDDDGYIRKLINGYAP